jgi:hypothetical protein
VASLECQSCGAPVTIGEPIPRDAECESCRRDLRSCRNCRHHDTRYNNACTEPMAEPVGEKERRNFCEYFYFNREPFSPAAKDPGREAAAWKRLDALFGGKPGGGAAPGAAPGATPPDRATDARRKLEDLFRKPAGDDSTDA